MCGICGIMHFKTSTRAPDEKLINTMTDLLKHRGPNDRGVWRDNTIALGHRRLSVIDLSSNGRQPMENEDGSVVISYNGEVYNFLELKEKYKLTDKGHIFKSRTDTEVILHLYEEIGLDMVNKLNGMFAIAIWDSIKNKLFLIRDRYGIKPLFYQSDDDFFRFASEIKSIIADDRVKRKPSLAAMHDFLTFNYIPGEQTAFEGIYEVSPAHIMTIDKKGHMSKRRYWDLSFETDESITEDMAIKHAGELMERSVKRRLIADVPIGILLSGGMDSSTLVALMHKNSNSPIHTFCVAFEDKSFDESSFAQIVSKKFNTIHHEVLVTPQKMREMLPKYLSYIDEPYGDGSAIPTYFVCGIAKDEVVVVLSGEGGDETFAGYETYSAYKASKLFNRIPRIIRQGLIAPIVNRLPVSNKKLSLEFKLKRFLGGQNLPPEKAHLWWRIVLTELEKQALYSKEVKDNLTAVPSDHIFTTVFNRSDAQDDLSGLLYLDSSVFLPDDLMIKNDRMSMAHSLEARVPFTDFELTEYMAKVPPHLKLKRFRKKHIMRRAMEDKLPPIILNKKKVGLEMPYSRWFKDELKDLLLHNLSPSRISDIGLFRPKAIHALVQEHMTGTRDNGRSLWGLLNYVMWHEMYIS